MLNQTFGRMQGISPERLVDIPAYNLNEWTLSRVLSLFDGVRTLTEVTRSLPTVLQVFAVDIVIFLLRYRWIIMIPFVRDRLSKTILLVLCSGGICW